MENKKKLKPTSIRLKLKLKLKLKQITQDTKTNKRQCPLSPVQVQDPWKQFQMEPERLWIKRFVKRWVFVWLIDWLSMV